ncbi:hypothetical protein Vadar_019561 [Vaccinium darrowii]|uniref:Uncharacterized protein n=1 Tax=Vaccinium darrowii TaxID=229202 RepID=A0ACB7ZCV8_9ERIC|nr:hypothetical protein Vadar_019561 [Vaccinium darrowii]
MDDADNNNYQGPQERGQGRPRLPNLSLMLNSHDRSSWKVKKILTRSDVNDLYRLMLKKTMVQEHILNKWNEGSRRAVIAVETEQGQTVEVWDANTDTTHGLVFKRWRSSGSFVFTHNWKTEFVNRRDLREGDEIGLRWDSEHSRFEFCVLSWAWVSVFHWSEKEK